MKIYIKNSQDYLLNMTDDELDDMYFDIIEKRKGLEDGNPRASYLDDLYMEVTNEIGARKHR